MQRTPDPIAREAKAIVALAFRNGPIENLHAGYPCPTCSEEPDYSRISDSEMKTIMKCAVNRMYSLLRLKNRKPADFENGPFNYEVQQGPGRIGCATGC